MTDDLSVLARRFVAAPRWAWRSGMRLRFRAPAWLGGGGERSYRMVGDDPSASLLDGDPRPDLTDAATLGCILALYEETRTVLSCPDPVYTYASAYGLFHPKTLEALVHALEAP